MKGVREAKGKRRKGISGKGESSENENKGGKERKKNQRGGKEGPYTPINIIAF